MVYFMLGEIMNFVPLHIKTGYTFLSSALNMERLFKIVDKTKVKALAITDSNSLYGLGEFAKFASSRGVKPLFGMDLSFEELTFTLIAKNEQGYLALLDLSYLVNTSEIDLNNFISLSEHLVVILGSHQEKLLDLYNEGESKLAKFLAKFTPKLPSFYLGLEINAFSDIFFANQIRDFASKYAYETLAFPLLKYELPEDEIVIQITDAIKHSYTLERTDQKVNGKYYVLTNQELENFYSETEINKTGEIAALCNVNFNQVRGSLLKFPLPEGETSTSYLKKQAYEGLKYRGIDLSNKDYIERLEYELKMINALGFNDYFLIVQDYVLFAKNSGILVGPGRGSAAGSLVCYCLQITEIDPLVEGLLFERFLNPERQTMPDIDIDFADYRRDEVVNYLKEKYGENRVAHITTFQTIGAKQSLRDIGRVYNYATADIDRISNTLGNSNYSLHDAYRYLPSFRKLVDDDPFYLRLVTLASKIEGLPRQSGLHAAGVILNETPIKEGLPVKLDDNKNLVTQYEMHYLEDQGYLKMDILGLTNLTVIEQIFNDVKKNYGITLDLDTLPYEEPKIYELIAKGQTMGLFQLESSGMNQAIKQVRPTNYDDIVAIIALFRPGPMKNIATYAKRKNGLEPISYISPDLEPILESTYGIIVYQEQIMQICQVFAGMNLAEADLFRRAISKKDANLLRELKEDFISGAIKLNHDEKIANKVFDAIFEFADYGFNKAHAAGYARLTCQMGYLKLHYPAEFYAAILGSTSVSSPKFHKYLREIRQRKITLLGPNVNISSKYFQVHEKALIFPLSSIKGLPQLQVEAIIKERQSGGKFSDLTDFIMRMYEYNFTLLQYERLIDSGALDELVSNRESARVNLARLLRYASIVAPSDNALQLQLDNTPPPRLSEIKTDLVKDLTKEYDALGMMLSGNMLSLKKDIIVQQKLRPLRVLDNDYYYHNVVGIIRAVKVIRTRKGDQMAFVSVTDGEKELDLTVFPQLYQDVLQILTVNNIIAVRARRDNRRPNNYIAETIRLLEDER